MKLQFLCGQTETESKDKILELAYMLQFFKWPLSAQQLVIADAYIRTGVCAVPHSHHPQFQLRDVGRQRVCYQNKPTKCQERKYFTPVVRYEIELPSSEMF